LIASFAGSS